ncbi:CobW family GTP-binding protein [Arthrobacter dokdonensis]|uniref:CobW family GTP-binding protein n=1 Tax=Arthrobacter dokdonellae TaxID=2211210 RepID=UPI001494C29B|nr:GTP-binding protein [Arthrobacter dokdonellae]
MSIIGGYLGSGKSTLVNRLLEGVLPGRTAVVVNDFGSVNIDADLIASADGDTIELTNGCICCQLNDDVARTMSALAAREDLDNVLCEVSGVGNPGELANWRDYPGFTPGVVAVCADATTVMRLLRDPYVGDTVQRQMHAAEVVLVTKTDLTTEREIAAAGRACEAAAPHARLIVQDPLDPSTAAALAFAPADATRQCRGAGTPSEPDHHVDAHASTTLEFSGAVAVKIVTSILAGQAQRLIRAKGTLQDIGGDWYEVQLSSGRVDVSPRDAGAPEPRYPGIVLIATGQDPHRSLQKAELAFAGVRGVRGTATR